MAAGWKDNVVTCGGPEIRSPSISWLEDALTVMLSWQIIFSANIAVVGLVRLESFSISYSFYTNASVYESTPHSSSFDVFSYHNISALKVSAS